LAVSQAGDLILTYVLFDDVEVRRALDDRLDVRYLVAGDDKEVSGLGTDVPVLIGGDLEHLLASRVTALADNAEGLSYGSLNLLDPLINLAEERLVPDDPVLAGQAYSLLLDQLVGTKHANDLLALGLQVAGDDDEAILVSPHALVLLVGQLDATQTQIVGALTQKRDLRSARDGLLGGHGQHLVRRPKRLLILD
jgi:hypothetical protein